MSGADTVRDRVHSLDPHGVVTLADCVTMPTLGYGVWPISDADAPELVRTALEVGYRHLDTAQGYGNERGVGAGLRAAGLPRSEVFVTTKLDNHRHRDARPALGESLERLGLDHVDLFLIHWPCPARGEYVQAWRDLVAARAEGLTRAIGVSNFVPEHLDAIVDATGVVPAVNQIEVHPTFAQPDLVAADAARDIITQAWSPLGVGADLTCEPVLRVAAEIGRTPAQVILRWHLHRGRVVFPKSSRPDRIAENFALTDVELTAAQLDAIDAADTGNRVGPDPRTFRG